MDLHIRLLGPPQVSLDGLPLEIARRQVRALLYYLASRPDPAPREKLCSLFWPDIGEGDSRRNLTRLLSSLQEALPIKSLVVAGPDQVALDHARVEVDTLAFQGLRREGLEARLPGSLEKAARLHRGPFLEGFSLPGCPEYETWASLEGEALEQDYRQVLAALVSELVLDGDLPRAIHYARLSLQSDELDEGMQRCLIELYALNGERSAALRQYELCLAALERELGVSPLPETRLTYQAVLQGQPACPQPAGRPEWTTLPSLDLSLVGRQAELERLETTFRRLHDGRGGAVIILGEAGVGKSRMLQEFARQVESRALVLSGAGQAELQGMPYHPVLQALRPLLLSPALRHSLPLDTAAAARAARLAEISRLAPELRQVYPNLPTPPNLPAPEARARLFDALALEVVEWSLRLRPLLLCLDDLHWADPVSLDWLGCLALHLPACRLLLLLTCRSEEAETLAGLRQALRRRVWLEEIDLEGLDLEQVQELLSRAPGPIQPPGLAQRLHRATGGNPYFLLETLRALLEAAPGEQPATSGQELPLPASLRDAIQRRLRRLSPIARQVLEAGAVLGADFDFELVRLAAGRGEGEALDALDELAARRLLQEAPTGYHFPHEMLSQCVYQGLSLHRRQLLHRRAAEALEALSPQNYPKLARHYQRAGLPGRAAACALQAGLDAKRVFAHQEALACFDLAITLLDQEAASLRQPALQKENRRLWLQAHNERGWALRLVGDMERYTQDLDLVSQSLAVPGLAGPALQAHLHWRQANLHRWNARHRLALQAAQAGLELSQAAGDDRLQHFAQVG